MAPLPAELPAGQHRLHPAGSLTFLEGCVEKREGQQNSRPRHGRQKLRSARQPAEAHGAEALRQLEPPGATQFQAMGAATGRQAQAGRPVPEKAEQLIPRQVGQQDHRVPHLHQGDRQAENAFFILQRSGRLRRRRQQVGEARKDGGKGFGGSLHQGCAEAAAQMYG